MSKNKQNKGIIDNWIISEKTSHETLALKRIFELQEVFLFTQYEPVKSLPSLKGENFIHRLEKWVSGFQNEIDQWAVFQTLKYFLFIGIQETEELYRCAVKNHLYPWLVDKAELDIFSDDFPEQLEEELKFCWPCPVTDSLRINSLLHCTGLDGQPLRPDWYSLRMLGGKLEIKNHINKKNYNYLVLFEDFVGSGSQCISVIEFALDVFPGEIFLSPLVVCHPGDIKLRKIAAASSGRLNYSPVVVLGADCLVGKEQNTDEPYSFKALRVAMENSFLKSGFGSDSLYGHEDVGCLFSSYSNCPNNTPPIYHKLTDTWRNPIFPRKPRIK